jgi:hypothetical protein
LGHNSRANEKSADAAHCQHLTCPLSGRYYRFASGV